MQPEAILGGTLAPAEAEGALRLDAENPWPGLLAYRETHAAFFHGRKVEADELFRRVFQKPLTLLFGQSGLGKTSLVNARLYPQLRGGGFQPIDLRFDFRSPEDLHVQMVRQVTAVLARELPGASPPDVAESLWQWLHRRDLALCRPDGRAVVPVLVFDQFEELFTVGAESEENRRRSAALLAELADAVENRPPGALTPEQIRACDFKRTDYRVVLSLREDYVAHLDSHAERMPSVGENRMRLTPLDGRQALSAVMGPGGRLVRPGVARKIVRFVAAGRKGPAATAATGDGWTDDLDSLVVDSSLLNLVCRELNRLRQERGLAEITPELLAETGDLQKILRKFYDDCVRDMGLAVPAFIERELVTEGGFRENIAEERARRMLREAGADPGALALLVKRRLLRIEQRLEQRRVELAHDVLCAPIRAAGVEREATAQKRRAEEELARAHRQRKEEEERRTVAEGAARRARRQMLVAVALLALAVAGAAFGIFNWVMAEKAKREADTQRKAALENASTARTNLALAQALMFASHARLAGSQGGCDDVIDAVLWATESLKATVTDQGLAAWKEAVQKLPSLPTFVIAHQQRPVVALEYDPTGAWIASLAGSGDLRVWASSDTQELLRAQLPSHTPQGSLAFSPDGQWLTAGSGDEVWVIATSDWSRKHLLRFNSAAVIKSLAFSQDGGLFAIAAYGPNELPVFETTNWTRAHTIQGYQESGSLPGRLVFSPDPVWLFRGRYAFKAQAEFKPVEIPALTNDVWDSVFLEGGRRLLEVGRARVRDRAVKASATSPGGVELSDAEDRGDSTPIPDPGPRSLVAVTPDGRRLAIADDAGFAHMLPVLVGTSGRLPASATVVALSPRDGSLLTGSRSGKIARWEPDSATGLEVQRIRHSTNAAALAFGPAASAKDRQWLAIGWADGRLSIHDPATAMWRNVTNLALRSPVLQLAFRPHERLVVLAGTDDPSNSVVRLFSVGDWRELGWGASPGGDEEQPSLDFSPAGGWILATSGSNLNFLSADDAHVALHLQGVLGRPDEITFNPAEDHVCVRNVRERTRDRRVLVLSFRRSVYELATGLEIAWREVRTTDADGAAGDQSTGGDQKLLEAFEESQNPHTAPARRGKGEAGADETLSGSAWARSDLPHETGHYGDARSAYSLDGRWRLEMAEDRVVIYAEWPADMIALACSRLPRNLRTNEWQARMGTELYRTTCPNLTEESKY